ncbi:MAG: Nif3-like dinuclear metal center hexameric protein [Tissierellia bacterium]|nr:Nif3-like dinuclear metal center hexameric protein [Tissierellia bacterium]MDD4780779.1 Nif3-like dinuclear metal center hexameric protein [Tissierellia bacterium]
MKLKSIIELINDNLKLKIPEKWDNSGLQIGDYSNDIKNIMLILDLDKNAVEFSVLNNIDLIITHHPFIFSPLKSIDFSTYDGKLIRDLIINNINVYSMHTNLDMADYGVNYELANLLGIKDYEILHIVNDDNSGYGGISNISPINVIEYANFVKSSLNCNTIKLYCNDNKKNISRVAFCGGSGSEFISDAITKGADIYITGDIKYHQAQDALKNNLVIIDAGHHYTEYHSIKNIQEILNIAGLNVIFDDRNTVAEIVL